MNNQIIIIFLHGLGGTAWLKKNYLKKLSGLLPYNVKFLAPQAKVIRFNFQEIYHFPLFLTGWYSIKSREDLRIGKEESGLLDSIIEIEKLIGREIKAGVPSQNIFVIGLSQGGSVALSLAMVSQYELGGIVGLATFLPYHELLEKEERGLNKQTPILMLHGKKDSIVPFDMGKESAQLLKKQGYYNLELISYSQTKHFDILSRSSWEVANFLNRILKERQIKPNKEKKEPEIKIIKIGTKHRLSVSVGNVVSIPSLVLNFLKKKKKKKKQLLNKKIR